MALRKGRFLQVFSFLAIACAAPCLGAVYFQTSWNTVTGNTEPALTDGYTFNGGCYGTNLLKVESGGVAGNNLYGIWMNGEQYGHSWAKSLPISQYDDFYYRFYVRVYPKNGMSYYAFHGIQNYDGGEPSNFYFSVKDNQSPSGWQAHIGSYATQLDGMDNQYWYGGNLAFNEWFRVEGHIHWYAHGNSAPAKWEIRLYDMNGNLVIDERNFTGMEKGTNLRAMYDAGRRMYLDGNTDTWSMGNNGPAGGVGTARMHDISCVALGNDPSVWGPVTGLLPGDKSAPYISSYFPAQNATNVTTAAGILLTLKDVGKGVDTNSLVMKVNGVTVAVKRSGAIWSNQLSYKPAAGFPSGAKITVEVSAKDLANPQNAMTPVPYSFTTAGTPGITPGLLRAEEAAPAPNYYNVLGERLGSGKLETSRSRRASPFGIAVKDRDGTRKVVENR